MGSSGILLILLAAFLLTSFVTGRLDWLKRLSSDTRAVQAAATSSPLPYGPTGAAPTSSGGGGGGARIT
jgi:hypothetical protein